jgi:hypothetical protein
MPATASHRDPRKRDAEPARELRRKTPPQALVDAINPLVRWLARSPLHRLVDGTMVVLHVTGRRTGRRFDIPVGYVRLDNRLLVTTQHQWRANLRDRGDVEATVCGSRRNLCLDLDEAPASIAKTYAEVIDRYGWSDARRRLGLVTASGEAPSLEQLEEAARAYRLAVLELSAAPGEPALAPSG